MKSKEALKVAAVGVTTSLALGIGGLTIGKWAYEINAKHESKEAVACGNELTDKAQTAHSLPKSCDRIKQYFDFQNVGNNWILPKQDEFAMALPSVIETIDHQVPFRTDALGIVMAVSGLIGGAGVKYWLERTRPTESEPLSIESAVV